LSDARPDVVRFNIIYIYFYRVRDLHTVEKIPEKMHAILLTGHGDLDRYEYREDWPTPRAEAGEVLIKVHACGLNNTDVNTRTGWYSKSVSEATTGSALVTAQEQDAAWGGAPIRFPFIQGADVCGTIVEAGAGVDRHLIGKRVLVEPWLRDWNDPFNPDRCGYFGSECDGGFADYTKVDARQAHPITTDLTNAELATFATSYITAENMLNRAGVGRDDVVLIPGASGGVGSALIQLARRRGAQAIAMCGEAKRLAVAALNPDAILPRAPVDLKTALRDAIGRDTVTVVADVVGGGLWPQLINALARNGHYTCSGAIAGPIVEFDLRTFYLGDLTFTGATIVPPGVFGNLVGYIERGEIKPLLAASYPLRDLAQAQQAFIAKRHVGNIVVTME
jgi:NADPH:quinone reductase-like Zn-dependent oxidoreductase